MLAQQGLHPLSIDEARDEEAAARKALASKPPHGAKPERSAQDGGIVYAGIVQSAGRRRSLEPGPGAAAAGGVE